MTATINGIQVTGTPAEIAELINLTQPPKITTLPGTGIYTPPKRPEWYAENRPFGGVVLCAA